MTATPAASTASTATPRRIAGQGALLFSGYASAQALSFARNAVIGHALSRGDFGIAATITLILQLVETLSDLGSDRLIVQATDGDAPRFVATAHTVLVLRGIFLSVVMVLGSPLLAQFFAVEHAAIAFQLAAIAPLIKGFTHLDCRRAQRRFDNRPQLLVEVVPQAAALALVLPAIYMAPDYSAVVWLAAAQALTSVAVSHALAERPYSLAIDRDAFKRQIAFGWPILASALPLIAVYQGDRIIIGRLAGMEALAGYTAAFMVTMVPGLIAAKVGHALMLPLFSETLRQGRGLKRRFTLMTEATVVLAAAFLCVFAIAGGALLPLVFGSNYHDLGTVTAILAAMWALRMVQAVAGMALMAYGETKPFFIAGLIRANALPFVLAAAYSGYGLAVLAAIGCAFEVLSMAYITVRLEQSERGLGLVLAQRAMFLVPAALTAALVAMHANASALGTILIAGASASALLCIGAAVMPMLRANLRLWLSKRDTIVPAE
jgi:O-antigen/teichoic acid export membrane protein